MVTGALAISKGLISTSCAHFSLSNKIIQCNHSDYHLDINIASKPLKNKLIEVNTTLKFEDKELNQKKSHFEMTYASIVRIDEKVKNEKELKKILLCDVQNKISSNMQKIFLNMLHDSGYPEVKFDKKIDFKKLYEEGPN